jgi:pyruvate dehydrogenase E2 component (dihydrolipoamide acetyltransferase)
MSHEIRVPRLGWSMEEGTFVGWLKKPGEMVRAGEPLFELEGEKATQAIEAVDAGVLHVPANAPTPGAAVAVGALLGHLLEAGESAPVVRVTPSAPVAETPHPAGVAVSSVAELVRVPNSPRSLTTSATVAAAPDKQTAGIRTVASPRARRVAQELGIDWTGLQGSGRGGRIREADVRKSARPAAASSRRRVIAERLRISRERTVPVTLTTTFDATGLVALREKCKSPEAGVVPTYTDIVACVVARVLPRHPHIAARRDNDVAGSTDAAPGRIDIAIAVHTPDGLVAPVLRGVGSRPLLELAEQARTLVERARAGKLAAAEMRGGAFTITNLGAYGIEAFTPVINYPDLAILGLGAIRREPAVLPDGSIGPGQRMTLSLTFDHAVLDGVPAAEFLREVAAALTEPEA